VGELQDLADRLDPVLAAVLVDVGDHLSMRPSGSVAKKSRAPDFKISFARRSSRFARSSSFNRARSSVVVPAQGCGSLALSDVGLVDALEERSADGTALAGTRDHKQTLVDAAGLLDQLTCGRPRPAASTAPTSSRPRGSRV